ncbi:MAG: hypothetical protein KDJ75_04950 [Alphaproteobacteria bacterium]|nr:hypothetical protein [Alphaproteobacteria bacterium]
MVENAFQIFEFKDDKENYEPVGDYTLIDTSEDPELTEKNVMNLVSRLNGRKELINVSNLTSGQLLYNIVDDTEESEKVTIMLRSHDKKGVSKENAVIKIEKGVFDDIRIKS